MGALLGTVWHVTTKPTTRALVLRNAVGLTQDQVAERSGGRLERTMVVKVDGGQNKATSDRVRAGLAQAYGVTRDDMAAYLDGEIDADEIKRRASAAKIPPEDFSAIVDIELRRAVEFRHGAIDPEYLGEYIKRESAARSGLTRDQYVSDIDAGFARWQRKRKQNELDRPSNLEPRPKRREKAG